MVRPDEPLPAPLPWWKRPGVWALAALTAIVAALAAFSRPTKPLVFTKPAPPPPPPAPPDVPVVVIPQVNTAPASTYEAGKVAPTSTASAVDDAEVDAALARLNEQDAGGTGGAK